MGKITHSKKKAKKSLPAIETSETSPAHYSDGHPLDKIEYLESKIILKGECFTSLDSFK